MGCNCGGGARLTPGGGIVVPLVVGPLPPEASPQAGVVGFVTVAQPGVVYPLPAGLDVVNDNPEKRTVFL